MNSKHPAVDICIIPAAGKGSRWAPVSGYLPKEMLPLIDRPVIEWVINEAVQSGCKEVIIVINKQKESIKKYLISKNQLLKKVKLQFVYQNQPKGLAHAILLCKSLVKNRPFIVALPDLPTISKKPVIKQLIETFETIQCNANIVSFGNFPPETLNLYGACLLERRANNLLGITHLCPSPAISSHQHNTKLRMSGRYIFRPEIFKTIDDLNLKHLEGELHDGLIIEYESTRGGIVGVEITGHTYDTGSPIGYVRANTAFFKKKSLQK